MADLAQLPAWRDALMAARYQGIRTVEYDSKRVTYASDAEMAAAVVGEGGREQERAAPRRSGREERSTGDRGHRTSLASKLTTTSRQSS